jgi:hypothetical protein
VFVPNFEEISEADLPFTNDTPTQGRLEDTGRTAFAKGLYVSGQSVVSKNANTVQARPRSNPQELFPHQVAAMGRLDELNRASSFSSLLVLPTGGGKTRTAVQWLVANALQEGD